MLWRHGVLKGGGGGSGGEEEEEDAFGTMLSGLWRRSRDRSVQAEGRRVQAISLLGPLERTPKHPSHNLSPTPTPTGNPKLNPT